MICRGFPGCPHNAWVEATGLVRIVRKSDTDIKVRDLYVKVDDGPEQTLKFGSDVQLEVPIGTHAIHATNRLYKRYLEFQVDADSDPVVFEVANTARGCAGVLFTVGGPYQVELRRLHAAE